MRRVSEIARRLVPAVCDISVTDICNATCDFCSFARDKDVVRDRRWIDRGRLAQALPILHRRGIRYVNFQGGEPLMIAPSTGSLATPAVLACGPGWLQMDGCSHS